VIAHDPRNQTPLTASANPVSASAANGLRLVGASRKWLALSDFIREYAKTREVNVL
jgi:hypothetical protein